MRLPIGKLVKKALGWLVPHLTDEVLKEIARRDFATDDAPPTVRATHYQRDQFSPEGGEG